MRTKELDGKLYLQLLSAGLENLKLNAALVNDLNVFPIADGDTGDNMCSTLLGGLSAAEKLPDNDLCVVVETTSKGMFLGARGNSGVILSQFFSGIAEGIKKQKRGDVQSLCVAFKQGVTRAYSSVGKPVEGTMLTVLREATEWACSRANDQSTLESFFDDFNEEAERSLQRTPELLDVLKEAGVVDSGGAGVLNIMEGFAKKLRGEILQGNDATVATTSKVDFSLFNQDSQMEYGYCTEFMLQLLRSKTNVEAFNIDDLTASLSTIGESIVAFKSGSVVKVHIHTFTPGAVLNYCQQFGEFLTTKIENMTLQHNEVIVKKNKAQKYKVNAKRKRYGVVAVATGKGIHDMFSQLGADVVIEGGQGHNPAVTDFVDAFDAVNADDIFVLPNNDNISLAARQSAQIYNKSNIHVIHSSTIGDGYSALSMLDLDKQYAEDIEKAMLSDIADSKTGLVSRAIRVADFEGVHVKQGDYLGICGKNLLISTADKNHSAIELLHKMEAKEKFFLVVFYGKEASKEQVEQLNDQIAKTFDNLEIYTVEGGQEVYDYILVLS